MGGPSRRNFRTHSIIMNIKSLASLSLGVAIVICCGCANKPMQKAPRINPYWPPVVFGNFTKDEVETRSWKLPNGRIASFISMETLHFRNRIDLSLVYYGTNKVPTCIDFYVFNGVDNFTFLGHDSDFSRIRSAVPSTQGERAFVIVSRESDLTKKRSQYSYEYTTNNNINGTTARFIMDY